MLRFASPLCLMPWDDESGGSGGSSGNPPPDQPTNETFDQPAVGDSVEIETVGPLMAVPGLYLDLETPDGDSSTYEVISVDPDDENVINARLVDAGTIVPGATVPTGATLRVSQTLAPGMAYVGTTEGYSVPLVVETAPVVIEANQATMNTLPQQRQAVVSIPDALVITEVEQPLPAAPLVGDRVVLTRGDNITTDLLVTPPLGYTIANQNEYRLPKTPQANAVLQYMGNNKWNLLAGANGGSTDTASGRVEFWVPDILKWENTGTAALRRRGPIWRFGDTLYQFGGTDAAGTGTNKIYTAAWPGDSGNIPAFVDSGATLPFSVVGARICLIDSTIWMIGAQDNEQRICSAPLATPLVWTNTGATIGERRDNAGFVVTPTKIGLITGHSGGGGYNSVRYTSITTPTAGWTTTAAVIATCWESYAMVLDNKVWSFGGFNENNVNRWTSIENFPDLAGWSSVATSHPTQASAEGFDLGDQHLHIGSGATPQWWCLPTREPRYGACDDRTGPVDATYLNGASWIGGDGRIYVVSSEAAPQFGRIWRSGRKKVYVDAAQVAASGPYDALRGVTEDGAPAIVSMQTRMANKPWLTNRRTTY